MNKDIRIPRESGVTLLSTEFRKNPDEETFQKLILHVVRRYVLRGFNYLGIPISVSEFSNYMGIPHNKMLAIMTDVADSVGYLNKDNSKQMMGMIASMSMQYALQDRSRVESQFMKLDRAQGDGYAPFISSEVNKTLKLLMESNKQLADSFNGFFNTSSTNVLNIFPNADDDKVGDTEVLDITKAIELLDEKLPDAQKALSVSPKDRLEFSDEIAEKYKLDLDDEVSAKVIKDEGPEDINFGQLMDYNEKDHKEDMAHKHLEALRESDKRPKSSIVLPE